MAAIAVTGSDILSAPQFDVFTHPVPPFPPGPYPNEGPTDFGITAPAGKKYTIYKVHLWQLTSSVNQNFENRGYGAGIQRLNEQGVLVEYTQGGDTIAYVSSAPLVARDRDWTISGLEGQESMLLPTDESSEVLKYAPLPRTQSKESLTFDISPYRPIVLMPGEMAVQEWGIGPR